MTTPDEGRETTSQRAMAQLVNQHAEQIAELLEDRDAARAQIAELRTALQELTAEARAQRGYMPVPPPRWWTLDGAAREQAIDLLRDWVTKVFAPGYGMYAEDIGPCWHEHTVCLFVLDWLSEWHKYLYLAERRTPGQSLGAQAEWTTRFMPLAVDMLREVTRNCRHREEQALGDALDDLPPADHLNGHGAANGNGRRGGRRHG